MGGNYTSKEDIQVKTTTPPNNINNNKVPSTPPPSTKQPTNIAEQLEKLKGYSLENRPGTKEYKLKCCKNKAINIVQNLQQMDTKYTLEEFKKSDLTLLNKIQMQITVYGEDLMKIILELDSIYSDEPEFKQSKKKKL